MARGKDGKSRKGPFEEGEPVPPKARGRETGPRLQGKGVQPHHSKPPVSKEELDEKLSKWKKKIEEEPFSPHEMGRNYPVQEDE